MCVHWSFEEHFSESSYQFFSKSEGRVLDELCIPFNAAVCRRRDLCRVWKQSLKEEDIKKCYKAKKDA